MDQDIAVVVWFQSKFFQFLLDSELDHREETSCGGKKDTARD